MSREIKFRGRRIDNGEWVYGNLMQVKYKSKTLNCIIPFVTNGSFVATGYLLKFISPCYEIDPATVGRFTGLHDKNGREIYEADWLGKDGKKKGFVVFGVWNCGCCESVFGFYLDEEHSEGWTDFRDHDMYEVLGNVHEHPHLLEVQP